MSELDAVLDRTYDALLCGNLPALGPLADALGALADPLTLDRASMDRILSKAGRNARLLQAAARGLRAARGRLSEIAAEPALTTYNSHGRRESVGPVTACPPRRF